MVFSDHTYGVLVVSAAQKFNEALAPLLPGSEYYPVCYVPNIAAARRELLSKDYDFVIVNAPLPDDFGTRFAVVSSPGVFALQEPTSVPTLQQSLKGMAAARERLRRMEEKATSIEEKMEEIRLVNRAKWLHIEQLKMTEAEAHRHIEKQAMDRCISKREIALGIIKTYA